MPITFAMGAVFGIAVIVASRNRGDGMPEGVWAAPVEAGDGDDHTYLLGRGQRVFMVAFFGCTLVAAPFAVINAVRTGPGVTVFVGCWLLIMGFMFRSWWRSSPTTMPRWSRHRDASEEPGHPVRRNLASGERPLRSAANKPS